MCNNTFKFNTFQWKRNCCKEKYERLDKFCLKNMDDIVMEFKINFH